METVLMIFSLLQLVNKSKKILLADDDSDFLEVTQIMFLDEGYDIVSAVDGEDAVVKYGDISPDIVFLDIKMPGMDGFEAFFRMIKMDPDARIFFMSSYTIDDEKFKKARNLKLRGLITKPFEFEDIEKRIQKHAK